MSESAKRFRAFISYSQKDKGQARQLHRALERYRLPRGVEGAGVGGKTRKLGRFFRDDEEMGAATDLGAALQGAIADAESLIVICSPNAAKSEWVNQEIVHFKRTGRADRIYAVIVAGTPNSDDERECFPPALRFELGSDGALSDRRTEPLAVDRRKEQFARVLVRLVAGLIQTPFDALWKREQRRARANAIGFLLAASVALLIVGAAVTQNLWRPKLDAYLRYVRFVHGTAELMAAQPGTTFQDCRENSSDCPVMVIIPEGSAMLGEPLGIFTLPLQQVTLPRFAVSQHEITWADWRPCVAAQRCPEIDHSSSEGDDRPVTNVSWNEARVFVDWLSGVTGERYRLLTDQEWEYAARGVTSAQTPPTRFSWGDADPVCDATAENAAAFSACAQAVPSPVGSFHANPFGLYDMHGNVWEWVETCSDADLVSAGAATTECSNRVIRGGSWVNDPSNIRSALRGEAGPSYRNSFTGFRVARTL